MRYIAITILLCISLTGCATTWTGLGVQELLQPPKLSQEQTDIYNALTRSVGESITLNYPRRGENTSAFVVTNLDNDPADEAIVFYTKDFTSSTGGLSLRINILVQEHGQWHSACDIGVSANYVQEMDILDVEGYPYMAISFNQPNSQLEQIKFFRFNGSMLYDMFNLNSEAYEIYDINDDGTKEFISINSEYPEHQMKQSTATISTISQKGLIPITSTAMDPTVETYIQINKGYLLSGEPALYIDGARDSSTTVTQVISCRDFPIVNHTYSELDSFIIDQTVRPYGLLCTDINGDGVFEIPTVIPIPNYEYSSSSNALLFTRFLVVDDHSIVESRVAYVDYQYGYCFELPRQWDYSIITVTKDDNLGQVNFFEYYSVEGVVMGQLCSIRVVNSSEFLENLNSDGFNLLKENGNLTYLYKNFDLADSALNLTIEEVVQHFELL